MEQFIPKPGLQPAQTNAQNTQNELMDLIIQHQKFISLPSRELSTFSGDLISYLPFNNTFIASNKTLKMTKTSSYFFEQYSYSVCIYIYM